jgi:hypothetical protein
MYTRNEINEVYLSKGICMLFKQAGFDWKIDHWYSSGGKLVDNSDMSPIDWNSDALENECSAFTLEVAQRWLREAKGIIVYVIPRGHNVFEYNIFCDPLIAKSNFKLSPMGDFTYNSTCDFANYDEALAYGIVKGIRMIVESEK